ncbi:hypothetical protein C6P41_002830 [Kluyveromyces marxianus]|nr:hypothetical protein C6P43_001040 [Kluyveromyces marxianus]KAG0683867.1 hypothetical protein C6P41_002830 [Kluyveromyces marxianus]
MGARIAIVLHDSNGIEFNNEFAAVVERTLEFLEDSVDYSLDIILEEKFTDAYHLDSILGHIYSIARDVLITKDLFFTSINVLFNVQEHSGLYDVLFLGESCDGTKLNYKRLETFKLHSVVDHTEEQKQQSLGEGQYRVSAVGGTFDHIHDGHKILLSIACFITSEKLIIGLTDQELLMNKKHKDMLEPFAVRSANVEAFLKALKPTLKIEMIAIRDVCGPTGTVPDIQALVVSRETLAGGEVVNKTRKEKGLSKLDIVIVNVLGGREEDGWKEKLSSTELRERSSKKVSQ